MKADSSLFLIFSSTSRPLPLPGLFIIEYKDMKNPGMFSERHACVGLIGFEFMEKNGIKDSEMEESGRN